MADDKPFKVFDEMMDRMEGERTGQPASWRSDAYNQGVQRKQAADETRRFGEMLKARNAPARSYANTASRGSNSSTTSSGVGPVKRFFRFVLGATFALGVLIVLVDSNSGRAPGASATGVSGATQSPSAPQVQARAAGAQTSHATDALLQQSERVRQLAGEAVQASDTLRRMGEAVADNPSMGPSRDQMREQIAHIHLLESELQQARETLKSMEAAASH